MKLWNYIFILTGISVLFALAGMNVAGLSDLLKMIGVNIQGGILKSVSTNNTLWNKIFGSKTGLLTLAGLSGAIIIGTFVTKRDKSFLIIPVITGVFVYWGSVLNSIIQLKAAGGAYGVFGVVLGIIGIALTVGFIQSCVDYFMGYN